jgi:hypothetical protein
MCYLNKGDNIPWVIPRVDELLAWLCRTAVEERLRPGSSTRRWNYSGALIKPSSSGEPAEASARCRRLNNHYLFGITRFHGDMESILAFHRIRDLQLEEGYRESQPCSQSPMQSLCITLFAQVSNVHNPINNVNWLAWKGKEKTTNFQRYFVDVRPENRPGSW